MLPALRKAEDSDSLRQLHKNSFNNVVSADFSRNSQNKHFINTIPNANWQNTVFMN